MITTLLSIGRVLREQSGSEGIKHHRYIRRIPTPAKGQAIRKYQIDVADDMTFNLSLRREIESEQELAYLFFLNYKTSNADTMKKYVFGDICRYMVKKPKETNSEEAEVNFVLGTPGAKEGNAYQLNSFVRGMPDATDLNNPAIAAFRACLEEQMPALLDLFEKEKSVYLNFRFGAEHRHWYELTNELACINRKLLKEFVGEVPGGGYVLTKFLHKTLSADRGAMPQFSEASAYKSLLFPSLDEVSDLLYAIDYSQTAMIRKGDIKIVVLPRSDEETGGSRLTARNIEQFFQARGIKKIAAEEGDVSDTRIASTGLLGEEEEEEGNDVTQPIARAQKIAAITQFDFIFSKASSSPSSPDIDLIELCGISKSRIGELDEQIKKITADLHGQRDQRFMKKNFTFKKPPFPLNVLNSFNNVLGDIGRDKKKYSSHLLKVLPQLYCGSYVQDDLLLPAFIAVTEREIREGSTNYDFLRFDLLFLWRLQDENRKDIGMLEDIQGTHSYRAGQLLGKMARPLRAKINSFEKNYVGLLSRRVAHVPDLISFQNFMDEKLIMHECAYPNLKAASRELTALLIRFPGSYNREYCVLGFFEAYFEPVPPKPPGKGEGAAPVDADSGDTNEDEIEDEG